MTHPGVLVGVPASSRTHRSPAQRPRRWYDLDRLPVTEVGKVDRSRLRAAIVAGHLRPLN